MSYFIGLFPKQDGVEKIVTAKQRLSEIFTDFDIPVRWSPPNQYHMTLIHLGERFSVPNRLLLKYKMRKFNIPKLSIQFKSAKLGISRRYKELVYLDILEGGEATRKIYSDLRSLVGVKDFGNFIPHITLGRVSKELSDQEYANLCRDLSVVSKEIDIEKIILNEFELKLMKSEEGKYQELMNFSTSSRIKS